MNTVANGEAIFQDRNISYLPPPLQTPARDAATSQGLWFKELNI